jgi:hypothetical protein
MLSTTRRAISYPNPDRTDRADIALHIGNVALAADADVIFNQGTDAARIAAVHQPGGGRFWYATDASLLWYDDGTNWKSVAPTSNLIGTLAARPAANSLTAGSTYFATDQIVDYTTDGTSWIRKGNPAGATVDWFKPDAAVPTGWVLYDGTNLPAATGIYADLYAHLGNTLTKPDTRGRQSVGLGTNGDVSAVGVSEGLAVGSRSPKHNSTPGLSISGAPGVGNLTLPQHVHFVYDPTHNHGGATDGRGFTDANPGDNGATGGHTSALGPGVYANAGLANHAHGINFGATGIQVQGVDAFYGINGAPSAGSLAVAGGIGPGGSRPTDTPAYITCSKIGKL